MNGESFLHTIAKALNEAKLEAVMIGNAAAALHGAPVTTLDVDFMFRKTPVNLTKLKKVARGLGAVILRPYYPASDLFRVTSESGLQLDFLGKVHGVNSLASLRSRAQKVYFGKNFLLVASLADIMKSKKAAGRPQDEAVLEILKKTLERQEKKVETKRPRVTKKGK